MKKIPEEVSICLLCVCVCACVRVCMRMCECTCIDVCMCMCREMIQPFVSSLDMFHLDQNFLPLR